mmetsp:Transcript_153622/g.491201  ORF Transcript_153622/g.491201 Transcript_153622/m.491201 type:complete len:170 (-) Transcript_153622:232-741(-)
MSFFRRLDDDDYILELGAHVAYDGSLQQRALDQVLRDLGTPTSPLTAMQRAKAAFSRRYTELQGWRRETIPAVVVRPPAAVAPSVATAMMAAAAVLAADGAVVPDGGEVLTRWRGASPPATSAGEAPERACHPAMLRSASDDLAAPLLSAGLQLGHEEVLASSIQFQAS